ncbi:MAG: hypothetical protein ABID54_06335 [Pseudomonadota bacterium]
MDNFVEAMERFFAKLEDEEVSKKVLAILGRGFQFKVTKGGSFAMRAKASHFSFEEGELPDQDFRRVTLAGC